MFGMLVIIFPGHRIGGPAGLLGKRLVALEGLPPVGGVPALAASG